MRLPIICYAFAYYLYKWLSLLVRFGVENIGMIQQPQKEENRPSAFHSLE